MPISMNSRATRLLGIATVAALVLLPVAAQAACKGGFCTSGRDVGDQHIVDFTTNWTHITHFNYNTGGPQMELGAHQTEFVINGVSPGQVIHYALQACTSNGIFGSKCTPWAYFTHTVAN